MPRRSFCSVQEISSATSTFSMAFCRRSLISNGQAMKSIVLYSKLCSRISIISVRRRYWISCRKKKSGKWRRNSWISMSGMQQRLPHRRKRRRTSHLKRKPNCWWRKKNRREICIWLRLEKDMNEYSCHEETCACKFFHGDCSFMNLFIKTIAMMIAV